MKTFFTSLTLLITISFLAQTIEQEVHFGGGFSENMATMEKTTDGGYIIAGHSFSIDGDVGANNGGSDYWIIKLDTNLNLQWESNLGGSAYEYVKDIQQTADSGYIIAGMSDSDDGDVGGNKGLFDSWIVKIDADGNLQWKTNIGGSQTDIAYSVKQTTDGGYIIAGSSESNDGDVGGHIGLSDCWIIKLSATGDLVWEKSFGGSNIDEAHDIQQTIDGGFIFAGLSASDDGDVEDNNGDYDVWIVKLDASGDLLWETSLGGSDRDWANKIQNIEGGYIVAGGVRSDDGDVGDNHGSGDYWIIKLDFDGNLVWETNLGGSNFDVANDIIQTTEGKFIAVGMSESNDWDVEANYGNYDFWVVELDNSGSLLWETNLGGSNDDRAKSIIQTADGKFLIAGSSKSSDGDVGANYGDYDFWVVKMGISIGVEDTYLNNILSLIPNPTTNDLNIIIPQKILKFEVLDMQGKLMISQTNIKNNTLDVSSLPTAVYFVKIYTEKTTYIKKLIKE